MQRTFKHPPLVFSLALLLLSGCYAKHTPETESPLPAQKQAEIKACQAEFNLIPEERNYQGLFTPTPPAGDLGNFAQLSPGLYRGARPTAKGLCQLKALGIKTVISLENLEQIVDWEKANAKKLGLEFVNLPMSVFSTPSPEQVAAFLKQTETASQKPVYFHCMQGSDRTGSLALVYRMRVMGWTFEKAYAEMQQHGFHEYLLGLQGFIRAQVSNR